MRLEQARRFEDLSGPRVADEHFAFDTLFDDSSFSARRRSRQKFKLLKRIASKTRALLCEGEKVRHLTRGKRYSLADYYLGGIAVTFLSRRAIILTNERMILLQIGNRSKPMEIVEQIRYSAIAHVSSAGFGRTRIDLTSGQKITLSKLTALDCRVLARLIQLSRSGGTVALPHTGTAREQRGIENLCSYCYQPVDDFPPSCPHCSGRFKSAGKAAFLSFLFPGMGDWYLGHHAHAAVEIAVAAVGWLIVLGFDIQEMTVPKFAAACATFFLTMHGGDALLTHRFGRMGLYPTVSKPLGVGESIMKFATVVGVFLIALNVMITRDILRGRAEQQRIAAEERERQLADPAIQEARAGQAARVEHITVATLAERIAAPTGDWSVVVLYSIVTPQTQWLFPQLVHLQKQYANQGVEFELYSVDYDQFVPDIPVFLAHHEAGFAPARLVRWPQGELSRRMTSLGINVGATWSMPLAALLDRNGTVVWQGQGVGDLNAIERLLAARIAEHN